MKKVPEITVEISGTFHYAKMQTSVQFARLAKLGYYVFAHSLWRLQKWETLKITQKKNSQRIE